MTVVSAMGQMFYSLSIAMGILITFGSYMKKNVSIEKSTENVEIFDTGIAIMAGLMIIPAVFAFSGGSTENLKAGPSLMFITIPKVFDSMGLGTAIGIAFFLLNVLLGVVVTFWYRTQQRSAEIGLRMAMGATRKGIFWQLVKEGLALLTIAFIPSTVIFANLLHMEVTQGSEIPPDMASRLLFGFVFSYAVMAAMIVVGISFPSYRAMRMHPADALRQE